MLQWVKDNRHEFLLNYTEIGNDTDSAEDLQEEHRNFESSCAVSLKYLYKCFQSASSLEHSWLFVF